MSSPIGPFRPVRILNTRVLTFVDYDILARTMVGEAANQGDEGLTAVANVVINRANNTQRFGGGGSWEHICLAHLQFSCWNGPERKAALMALGVKDKTYRKALSITLRLEDLDDLTHGADHYCTAAVVSSTSWTRNMRETARIRDHVFFKE